MRKRLYLFIFILLISSHLSVGKDRSKWKPVKGDHTNFSSNHLKTKLGIERTKRSINDEDDKPFWANRGKKQSEEDSYGYISDRINNKIHKASENIVKEPPFWGNRGRRDSSSVEDFSDIKEYSHSKCPLCNNNFNTPLAHQYFEDNSMERRIDTPFWGNRGRRNSDEDFEDDDASLLGRNRGRILEDEPFWGNRGRREDENPFWGNRGRRENRLPFWGSRGRHAKLSKFGYWAPGDREYDYPFWDYRDRRRGLKESIRDAIDQVEDSIVNIARSKVTLPSTRKLFSKNQSRESVLKHLFSGAPRHRSEFAQPIKKATEIDKGARVDAKSLLYDNIYADEPHYIIVERSSRSSGEVDPFYITRGKKELNQLELAEAARGRRGAIEEIVKSVKNDPYFIVRGKKDFGEINRNINVSMLDKLSKAKDLICTTYDLILIKDAGTGKVKRDVGENDRNRRATLKKLAAQLQIDPYFVSRGKKSGDRMTKEENFEEFMNQLSEMCD